MDPQRVENEEWRPRAESGDTAYDEDQYEVSNGGRVRNVRTGRHLRNHKGSDGYITVRLSAGSADKKSGNVSVHRLVARAFLQAPGPTRLKWTTSTPTGPTIALRTFN